MCSIQNCERRGNELSMGLGETFKILTELSGAEYIYHTLLRA